MRPRNLLRRMGWVILLGLCAALARADDGALGPIRSDAYGGTPDALVPYHEQGAPDRRFFRIPPAFRGPADAPADAPADGAEAALRVGCFVPKTGPDAVLGRHAEQGARLAFEQAEARRGPTERRVELIVRDEQAAWGTVANLLVRLVRDEHIVAAIGALEDTNTHVLSRLLLKLELPLVNASGSDPTLTEHNIPWLVRVRPDDRQTGYALVKRIYVEDGLRRVAVVRGNDRYSRMGIAEFTDASRRLGHPVCLEVRFESGEQDLRPQIERVRQAAPDAIVLWGRPIAAARALRALRRAGLQQPVFGPDRLVDPRFLKAAGGDAEGVVATHAFDPARTEPHWVAFVGQYRARYHEAPDEHAAFAYDAATILIEAIRAAGADRAAVRKWLYAAPGRMGVSGPIRWDPTRNNVRPMQLGQVVNGAFRFAR